MADRTVRVVLDAVTAAYEAKMAKAGVTTKGVASSMDDLGKRGSDALNKMSGGLVDVSGKTAAVAGGVAIAGAAVLAFVNTGIDAFTRLADQVDTYQDITGSSAEESSRMVAIANTLGVSTDTLAGGMARLSRNVTSNAEALRAQGVEIGRNADGSVNLSETLLNVADAYQRAGSGAAGNAVAQAAFGRNYMQLIDILERSRTELEGFWATAERNQQILSDEDLQMAREYGIATRELEMAWQGLAVVGAEALLPIITDVADGLTTVIGKMQEVKDSTLGDWLGKAAGLVAKGTPAGQVISFLSDLGSGSGEAADDTKGLSSALDDVGDAASDAKDDLVEYDDIIGKLIDRTFGVDEASGQLQTDLASLAQRIADAREAGDQWATSLDSANTTGIENRETLRRIAESAGEVAQALVNAGEDPRAAMQQLHANLLTTLAGLGFNRAEAENLLGVILRFPSNVGIAIDVDTARAEAKLERLLRLIQLNAHGIDVLEAEKWSARAGQAPPTPLTDALVGLGSMPTITPSFGSGSSSAPKGPTAEDLRRAEDERYQRMFDFGGISVQEYTARLNARIGATERFSEEWARLMGELNRVNEQVGQGWRDAAEAMQSLEDAGWEVLRRQHEMGEISTQTFLAQLERRLAGLVKYSDEYWDVWQQIQQLRDDISGDELAIIEAVEKQRLYDQAFADLAYQRALSDLRMTAVPSAPIVVQAGSTKSWSPNITMVTPDPARSGESVLQQSRDDAYLRDL